LKNIINHKSLAEYIFQDLENKIIAGTLKPGQRIVEEELCRSFGVSRSPVREALRILESQGFVLREPRRGVTVTKVTLKEAEDITKGIDQEVQKQGRRIFHKYPLTFTLLSLTGFSMVLYGYERLFDKTLFFKEHPVRSLFLGLVILLLTGTLYKWLQNREIRP